MAETVLKKSKRLRSKPRKVYTEDCHVTDAAIEGKRSWNLAEKLKCEDYKWKLTKHKDAKDFTVKFLQEYGFKRPLHFACKDGLGLRVPDTDFSIEDVMKAVGARRKVDVMNVLTQEAESMYMKDFVRYYQTSSSERKELLHVISLEFSHTPLEQLIRAPATVEAIDWSRTVWPRHLIRQQKEGTNVLTEMKYPKVRNYCLMSVGGCFTDFHIDFGGSSVWYHVLRGSKVFWMIPPTDENLQKYQEWVLSPSQHEIFFAETVQQCEKVTLKAGDTFMIPTGWIHGVYTPEDSLIFGGNYLHSYSLPIQLKISEMEETMHVPLKFRYPFFNEINWYVMDGYLRCLAGQSFVIPPNIQNNKRMSSSYSSISNENSPVKKAKLTKAESADDDCSADLPVKNLPTSSSELYLTKHEYDGMRALYKFLKALPSIKRGVPTDIRKPEKLLKAFKRLLKQHAQDDFSKGVTGIPILKWNFSEKEYLQRALDGNASANDNHKTSDFPDENEARSDVKSLEHKKKKSEQVRQDVCGPGNITDGSYKVPIRDDTHPTLSLPLTRPKFSRRVRCSMCTNCQQTENCNDCRACRANSTRKLCAESPTGTNTPGRTLKTCENRICLHPVLSTSALCIMCKKRFHPKIFR